MFRYSVVRIHIFWDHNIKKTRHRLWRSVSWTPFSKTLYPPQNRYSTLDTKEYFEQSLLESYRINCVFVFVSLHSSAKRPKSFWNMFSAGVFRPHQSLHVTFYTDTARKSQEALQVGIQLHQVTDRRATLKSFDAATPFDACYAGYCFIWTPFAGCTGSIWETADTTQPLRLLGVIGQCMNFRSCYAKRDFQS